MTKQEIELSSKRKVQAIEKLMKQLEITATPEEIVTREGIIRKVVYYTDNEKYELDEEVVAEDPQQAPNETQDEVA